MNTRESKTKQTKEQKKQFDQEISRRSWGRIFSKSESLMTLESVTLAARCVASTTTHRKYSATRSASVCDTRTFSPLFALASAVSRIAFTVAVRKRGTSSAMRNDFLWFTLEKGSAVVNCPPERKF